MSALDLEARAAGHSHVVGFYDRDEELVESIVAFLTPSLRASGAVVVVATPAHARAVEQALRADGFSIHDLTARGRYRSFDAATMLDTFRRGRTLDIEHLRTTVDSIIAESARAGEHVCVFGEMVALLWSERNVAGAIAVESLWDDLSRQLGFEILCAYPTSALEGADDLASAKLVCDHHSAIMPMAAPVDGFADGSADAQRHVRSFAPTPASLRDVRGFVHDALRRWRADQHALDSAAVVVTELATNAIAHAQSPFRVSISRSAETVEIAVRDASATSPERQNPEANPMGGRGIVLVAALADTWGTRKEHDGKTVWAILALTPTV